MAEGAGLTVEIEVAAPPIIEGARPLAISRDYTRASESNREFLEGRLRIEPGAGRFPKSGDESWVSIA